MEQQRLAEWEEVSGVGLKGGGNLQDIGGNARQHRESEAKRRDSAGRGMNPGARCLLRLNEWCCS